MKFKKQERPFLKLVTNMRKQIIPYMIGVIGNNLIMAFCFNIVMAILMKDLFNAASGGGKDLFIRAVIIAVSSLLIAIILQPIFVFLSSKAQKKTMNNLRVKAYNHMIELPVSYFEKEHSGNIMSRLTNDIKIIEDIYHVYIPRICFMLFLGLGSLALMFIYDWKLSLYATIFELLSIFISVRIAKRIKIISDDVQTKRSKVNEKFLDMISGFKTTKIFQIENQIVDNYTKENTKLTDYEKKKDNLDALINTVGLFFYSSKSIGLIILGIYMIIQGQTDIGTLFAIFNLMNNIGLLSNIGGPVGKLQASMAGLGRVESLLYEDIEYHQYVDSCHQIANGSVIELKDITFSYGENYVLDKLSISVQKGESIALVGKSGCGKSTIIKLLLGFYECNDGEIYIEGKSISSYSFEELREKIAYVPQVPYLFDGTIKDNIRYGRMDSTDEEIFDAAKMANAHDFILEQKADYDTLIGEGGANLSGGQKQRIAIARAINKGSSILLLDEATSALDSEAEEKIQIVIDRIMKEKTVLIITHRLSTIRNVDKIYTIESGSVV